ncbi:hypothetical protein AYO38_06075 [bacterium SCGC AG-212-C10]|nr:hypothetical protein AYO38_06075 [bacterium SCGC AG-212-C10]
MEIEVQPFSGFGALKMKQGIRERLAGKAESISLAERAGYLELKIASGPLGKWWKQIKAHQAQRGAAAEAAHKQHQVPSRG